jgi:hypothetical protein
MDVNEKTRFGLDLLLHLTVRSFGPSQSCLLQQQSCRLMGIGQSSVCPLKSESKAWGDY